MHTISRQTIYFVPSQSYLLTKCLTYQIIFLNMKIINCAFFSISGIPFLFFVLFIPLTASEACLRTPFWFSFHYIACFTPMFASLVYHLFMCHHTGAKTYSNLLCFDMCGIWVVNSFGALCGLRATLFCFPIWRKLALIIYLATSFVALSYIVKAPTPKDRLIPFAVFGVLRYIFLIVRLTLQYMGFGCGTTDALVYCVLMDCCACIGGVINIARVPEKWFPGWFDIVGNSHQIMHVLTAFSVLLLHFGSTKEFEWMDSYNCAA